MAFVQSSIAYAFDSASSLASTALTTSDGDTLCVGFAYHYGLSDVAISDNYGNTWTPHPANPLTSSSPSAVFAWVASNIAGGADHVVTITFTFASLLGALIVHEYSGRASSSVIDASGSGVDASSTLSHSNGSVTSITAGDDVFAFCGTSLSNFPTESMTFGSGWTLPANSESSVFAGAVYQADVAPGTYTLDYTTPSGYACYGAGLLFALAPAGGGGISVSLAEAGSAGASFSASVSAAGALSAGTDAALTLSAQASLHGALAAGLGASTSETTGGNLALAFSAGASGEASIAALAQATAAISAGLKGAESWAAQAQAAAQLAAAGDFGAEFAYLASGAGSAAYSAGSAAAASFLAAAETLASLTESASLGASLTGQGAMLGTVSAGSALLAALAGSAQGRAALEASGHATGAFAGAARPVAALGSAGALAFSLSALTGAVGVLAAGAALGASFAYVSPLVADPRYLIARQIARAFSIARSTTRSFTVSAMAIRFNVKGPAEKVVLTFDFSADLPSGTTLSGDPTISYSTTEGSDSDPSAIANGEATLDDTSTEVLLPVKGGTDGCEYTITVTQATTNSNLVLTLVGILPVRANLN